MLYTSMCKVFGIIGGSLAMHALVGSVALGLSLIMGSYSDARAIEPTAVQAYDWLGDIQPPTQVNERIWRSGRPTETQLRDLYARGVRVIIDLEQDQNVIRAEGELARAIGFEFHSYPTDSFWAPDDKKIDEILEILRTSSEPVLVHCYHGEDRTGLVIGLTRVFFEKWTPSKAYEEMLERGFHRVLLGLDRYFKEKTAAAR
jgi:tyrosine-protein phosphatase SIW14